MIWQHYREADNYKLCIFYSELRIGGRETEIHHKNCFASLACSSLKTGEKKINFAIVFSPLSVSFVAPKKVTRCVCVCVLLVTNQAANCFSLFTSPSSTLPMLTAQSHAYYHSNLIQLKKQFSKLAPKDLETWNFIFFDSEVAQRHSNTNNRHNSILSLLPSFPHPPPPSQHSLSVFCCWEFLWQ